MKTNLKANIAGLLGYSIFGFTFIFSKIALETAPTFVVLSIRFTIAFLALSIILFLKQIKIELKGKPVKNLLLMGFAQPVLYFIFEIYGISMTTAAFSGVMIGLSPIAGVIFGALLLKERPTALQIGCTVLSVVGVLLTTTGGFGNISMLGTLLLLGAVISSAFFVIFSRSVADKFSAFERTYVMMALGSVTFTIMAFLQNNGDALAFIKAFKTPSFWVAISYLSIMASVCAFLLINYSVKYISAGRTLIYSNFTTVISVLAGILIMNDNFSLLQLLGIALITISVFGVSYKAEK